MRVGTNYYSKQSTLLLTFTQHKSWQCCCATLYRHWLVFLTFVSNLQFTYYTCCFVGCFFVAIGVATFYTLFIFSQFFIWFFPVENFYPRLCQRQSYKPFGIALKNYQTLFAQSVRLAKSSGDEARRNFHTLHTSIQT